MHLRAAASRGAGTLPGLLAEVEGTVLPHRRAGLLGLSVPSETLEDVGAAVAVDIAHSQTVREPTELAVLRDRSE